jgi:hypothetical protein
MLYNRLSSFLKEKYGEKIQRLPINAGFTCPNKTGDKGTAGCIYCETSGSGFAAVESHVPIEEQIRVMIKRYENVAKKFMAYFQANTNTFAPVHVLKSLYDQSLCDDRIEILDISTRPDCVNEDILDLIASYLKKVDVYLEFGVESTNTQTLKFMNRGHYLSDVIKSVLMAKKKRIEVILHFILDFPTDSIDDVIEMAKFCNVLNVDGVKLHSLYIAENSQLGLLYKENLFSPLSMEEYIERTVTFLQYLSPKVVIHRMVAEPPHKGTLHGNWGISKAKLLHLIELEMKKNNRFQGQFYKK